MSEERTTWHSFPKPVNPNAICPGERAFRNYDELRPAVRMSQMQLYISLLAREMVASVQDKFAHELVALQGWVAGMGKQQFTEEFECMGSEGLRTERIAYYAHPLAIANAVIVNVMGKV